MKIQFEKFQATGNDFIIIDNRLNLISFNDLLIANICDRKFGIGSDGLILVEKSVESQFKMVFYNPDGSQSLCGNGCRAAIRFAETLNLTKGDILFDAYDGLHKGVIKDKTISLQMSKVHYGRKMEDGIFLDTGSPHFVLFVNNVDQIDVFNEGKKWRHSSLFGEGGANINFVEIKDRGHLSVRTYERGVENETLSCGTGVVAAALAASERGSSSPLKINTKGGILKVNFSNSKNGYENIWLEGPAEHVFSGTINL